MRAHLRAARAPPPAGLQRLRARAWHLRLQRRLAQRGESPTPFAAWPWERRAQLRPSSRAICPPASQACCACCACCLRAAQLEGVLKEEPLSLYRLAPAAPKAAAGAKPAAAAAGSNALTYRLERTLTDWVVSVSGAHGQGPRSWRAGGATASPQGGGTLEWQRRARAADARLGSAQPSGLAPRLLTSLPLPVSRPRRAASRAPSRAWCLWAWRRSLRRRWARRPSTCRPRPRRRWTACCCCRPGGC